MQLFFVQLLELDHMDTDVVTDLFCGLILPIEIHKVSVWIYKVGDYCVINLQNSEQEQNSRSNVQNKK